MPASNLDIARVETNLLTLDRLLGADTPLRKGFSVNSISQVVFRISDRKEIASLLTPLENALSDGGREELFRQVLEGLLERSAETDPFCEAYLELRGKLRQNSILVAKLLAHILTTPELLVLFLKMLPEKTEKALELLALNSYSYDVDALRLETGASIISTPKHSFDTPKIAYSFALCTIRRGEYDYKNGYKYRISLPLAVRAVLRRHFLAGQPDPLTPLDDAPKVGFSYNSEAFMSSSASILWSFMSSGQLEYSSSGEKPLKTSLRTMHGICGLPEFFPPTLKELDALAAQLLVSFLDALPSSLEAPTSLALLEKWFEQYRKGVFNIRSGLLWMFKDNDASSEQHVQEGFLELLRKLPDNAFISAEGLKKYVLLYNEQFALFAESKTNLRFMLNPSPEYQRKNPYHRMVPIHDEVYFEAVIWTMTKGMMFFFAALGLVEIVYGEPVHGSLHNGTKPYLSPFDCLRAVRITELGKFLIGRTAEYTPSLEHGAVEHVATFDEQHLILGIHADDKLRLMGIERFVKPIMFSSARGSDADSEQKPRRYFKMEYSSFLQDCTYYNDVVLKASQFRNRFVAQYQVLPRVWEDFLENVLAKVQPLQKVNDFEVFEFRSSPELMRLLTNDTVLRSIVLKAEGHRILVEKNNVQKLMKRLREFGYLMT
jgi:hypothetical protein